MYTAGLTVWEYTQVLVRPDAVVSTCETYAVGGWELGGLQTGGLLDGKPVTQIILKRPSGEVTKPLGEDA